METMREKIDVLSMEVIENLQLGGSESLMTVRLDVLAAIFAELDATRSIDGKLNLSELDTLLERWDATAPHIQRGIVTRFAVMYGRLRELAEDFAKGPKYEEGEINREFADRVADCCKEALTKL
jgi:hypothetical protein